MIPMFLILVVALTAIVGSMTFLTTTGIRSIGQGVEEQKAFYIAEAGLNKAIWNLTTPPEEGGMGLDWRTGGLTESFAGGSYTMIVEEDSESIKISSVSSYKGMNQAIRVLAEEDFAGDFVQYSVFSDADFDMDTLCEICGNLFADGDIAIPVGSRVIDGFVAVTEGHTITGGGEYVEGELVTVPEPPNLDTTYYDGQIAIAEAGGPSVLQGTQNFNDLDLNGLFLYVDGTVNIDGNITGAGGIISTGIININADAIIGEKIKLIARENVNIKTLGSRNPEFGKNVLLFAGDNIGSTANFINQDPFFILANKNVTIGNNNQISGIIYGGKVNIGNGSIIQGVSICGSYGSINVLEKSSRVIYKRYKQKVPPGFKKRLLVNKWLTL